MGTGRLKGEAEEDGAGLDPRAGGGGGGGLFMAAFKSGVIDSLFKSEDEEEGRKGWTSDAETSL